MKKLLMLLSLVLVLAACSGNDEGGESGKESGESKDKDVLNVAYHVQPPSFDPHYTQATATRDLARNVFETLVSFDEDYQVQPVLAESFTTSEDNKTITFKLREGIKFHNGDEMKAEDVAASMNRWKEINTQGIAYFSESEFKVEDDYTVLLEMDRPLTIAPYILANPNHFAGIMPKSVIEEATDTGVTEFIGTGPFEYIEWVQDQYIELAKNEAYTPLPNPTTGLVGKREPLVDSVFIYFVTDSATRLAGIQTGEYDVALAIPTDNMDIVEKDEVLETQVYPGGYMTIILNKQEGIFANEKARQAINMAVNKNDALTVAFSSDDYFDLEPGLLSKSYATWHTEVGKEVYEEYNPEKAKQLFEEAGYDGTPLRLLTTRHYEDQYQVAVVVQQQLEEIGINVDLQVYDWPTLSEMKEDPTKQDMHVMGYSPVSDPTKLYFLDSRLKTAGWSDNQKLDGLMDELIVAENQDKAKKVFEEIQKEHYNYLPIIKLGDYNRVVVNRNSISNFEFFEGPTLWDVEKK